MTTTVSYSLLDPELARDPYPYYEALRRDAPVFHNEAERIWVVSRHEDVVAASRASTVFTSARGSSIQQQRSSPPDPAVRWLPATDPPVHTTLRRMVNKAFTPGAVAAFEPRVRDRVRMLLDQALDERTVDWVGEFAALLPMGVIGELLGTDEARIPDMRRWSNAYIAIRGDVSGQDHAALQADLNEMHAFFRELTMANLEDPRPGIISDLAAANRAGTLSLDEIVAFCVLLLIGGNETTSSLIGSALHALLTHPGSLAALADDPSLVPVLVEETLRWDSPTQHAARFTLSDATLAGGSIPAGESVVLLWASANRDESVYTVAGRFRLDRSAEELRHVAFGSGVHACLGAALARLEGRVAFEELLARVADVSLDGEPTRLANVMVRGLTSLPVILKAR